MEDIGLILRGLIKDNEYSLTTNGTTTAHCIVNHNGTGVVAAPANSINVIGVESRGLGHTTGLGITFKSAGITPVATYSKVTAGKNIKSGPDGLAVEMLDASHVNAALGGGEYTTVTGVGYANQPANDTVDVISAGAGDTVTVTVYGLVHAGTVIGSEAIAITGGVETVGIVVFDTILGATVSAAHAGTISIHEHSGSAIITTILTGSLSTGIATATDPRAYCGKFDIICSDTSTKKVGIVGKSITGAALSEQITLNGATKVPTVNEYVQVTTLLFGDVEAARTISATTRTTEDDEHVKVGVALTSVTTAGEIYAKLV